MRRRLHLAQILESLKGDRSYYSLQNEIWDTYNEVTKRHKEREANGTLAPVHRHKLKTIVEEGHLNITEKELEVLAVYLETKGHSLNNILLVKEEGILNDLAKRHVVFLVGGRPRGGPHPRHDVSIWDVRAYSHILNQLTNLGCRTQTSIEDVIWDPSKRTEIAAQLDKYDAEHTSVCAIGSPRSLIASDLLLERTFSSQKKQFPFEFFFESDETGLPGNTCVRVYKCLPSGGIRDKVQSGKASVLRVHGKQSDTYELDSTAKPYHDYGLIVAKKFEDGRIHLVLAGLSGIGTYAAATLLSDPNMAFPTNSTSAALTLYALAKADVYEELAVDKGDPRTYKDIHFALQPQSWPAH